MSPRASRPPAHPPNGRVVTFCERAEVGTLVLLIAITVWVMDILSAKIRERIV